MLNSGIDGKKAPFNFKRYPDDGKSWELPFSITITGQLTLKLK